MSTPTNPSSYIEPLLSWYQKQGRDLPWRQTTNPYPILVSECMLQQTQVQRVIPYYHRWLERFPTWQALATASTVDVLHLWSGLGYNRRALALQSIAQQVAKHGEPQTAHDWLKLKGVGPYTSAAVATFSRQEAVMPVDTNVRRLLGRALFGIPFPQLEDDARITTETSSWLPSPNFHEIPQALFDVASSICKKRPECEQCPLKDVCKAAPAFLAGTVEIPKRSIKKATESRHNEKPFPDRIYRGRIVKLLRERTDLTRATIGPSIDPDFDPTADQAWLEAMIERLMKDNLLHEQESVLRLGPR